MGEIFFRVRPRGGDDHPALHLIGLDVGERERRAVPGPRLAGVAVVDLDPLHPARPLDRQHLDRVPIGEPGLLPGAARHHGPVDRDRHPAPGLGELLDQGRHRQPVPVLDPFPPIDRQPQQNLPGAKGASSGSATPSRTRPAIRSAVIGASRIPLR